MLVASTPQIRALIANGAPVAIGISGGKDSQAAALSVVEHLEKIGHDGARIVVHSDLGSVELVVLRRERGGLMDRWERRWRSGELACTIGTSPIMHC